MRITLTASNVSADLARRTLTGTVYRYGETGLTSAGPLAVAATMPPPPVGLDLTEEHDRSIVRGAIALVDNNAERLRCAVKVADGAAGDAALADAIDRKRAGFSFDIEDAEVVDGVIVSGTWAALGQVADPAFNSARIDQIAASSTHPKGTTMLTDEQRARLAALLERTDLNESETAELTALQTLDAAAPADPPADPPAESSASTASRAPVLSAVPNGAPQPPSKVTASATSATPAAGQAFAAFAAQLAAAMGTKDPNKVGHVITAALQDITHSAHTSNIEQPAWSGELWSGLLYEPIWTDLFSSGDLTSFEGIGWRFTSKLEIQDYAGDKAAIPSDNVTTETSGYEAARMAVGVDVDRKFYDFPNAGFVEALWAQVRESWAIKLDGKVRAYALAKAVAAMQADGITPVAAQPTLLKAAAVAARALKRRRVGRATGIVTNEDDYFTLMDLAEKDLPVFLELFGIDPLNFRADESIPTGTVIAVAKPAATIRTLPGSPVRVSAQALALGGVDDAFFGYWAIEEHHKSGIAKATFTPS